MARLRRLTLPVLHAAFGLTGVLHAIGGALLPALARSLNLADSRSGELFFCYYIGTAIGALLCVGRYARLMPAGFIAAAACCAGIAAAPPALLLPLFLLLGISVGLPMSAVSIYAGRMFPGRAAAPLTLLNFTWSAGALAAPLFAARLLVSHSWRSAYGLLAAACVAAALVCWLVLEEPPEAAVADAAQASATGHLPSYGVIALFAFLAFLEVGIENTTATWLATYAMRIAGAGAAWAAASSSFYWCGFLVSRGVSSLLLLRVRAMHLLVAAACAALLAAGLLLGFSGSGFSGAGLSGVVGANLAMLLLGAALAPIFPILLVSFFTRSSRASDLRWVLALCGFGGSVLPWLAGLLSTRTNSLRLGLSIVPAALLLLLVMLPLLRARNTVNRAP
jgi:fucose permease